MRELPNDAEIRGWILLRWRKDVPARAISALSRTIRATRRRSSALESLRTRFQAENLASRTFVLISNFRSKITKLRAPAPFSFLDAWPRVPLRPHSPMSHLAADSHTPSRSPLPRYAHAQSLPRARLLKSRRERPEC